MNAPQALVKLDALTPFLLRALEGPLLRALASAHSRSSHFLTQLLWAFGHEQAARPLLLAVAPQLLGAMAAAAPNLDGQAISTAWWALGELTAAGTQRPQEEALHLASLAPDLLPRLAVAARAAAGTLTFQGISQASRPRCHCGYGCLQREARWEPTPSLSASLLIAGAARLHQDAPAVPRQGPRPGAADRNVPQVGGRWAPKGPPTQEACAPQSAQPFASYLCCPAPLFCRLGAGEERPTPQAISLIVQALARMGCAPACHWCPLRGQQVNVLDDLGAALVAQLHAAQPQARLLLTASWPQRSVC